jgi:hypothetical protein
MTTSRTEGRIAKKLIAILIYILLILAIFIILATLKLPSHTYLWREIHNSGHTPLFGAMSLLMLGILMAMSKTAGNGRLWLYISAAAITIGLGAILEIVQIAGPGDADIFDLLRDIAGVTSFTLLAAVFDRSLKLFQGDVGRKYRITALATAIIILVSSLIPVGLWTAAYINREKAFPRLLDFDSAIGMKFVRTQDAYLERTAPPAGWSAADGKVGKLTFLPGQFPGLSIAEAHPDWRGYDSFKFNILSELDKPVKIWFRIDDLHHNNEYNDRFNDVITVNPGPNTYEVSLEKIGRAPEKRVMNMGTVRSVMLFGINTTSEFTLYFDNFRLE